MSNEYIKQLQATLEFCGSGPIPYDIATKGIIVEEQEAGFINLAERVLDMRLFNLSFRTELNAFVTNHDGIFDDGTECIVPWDVFLLEPPEIWWQRIGELQLHRCMAEIPDGFEFRFYPFNEKVSFDR
jgi:hypothetical protein